MSCVSCSILRMSSVSLLLLFFSWCFEVLHLQYSEPSGRSSSSHCRAIWSNNWKVDSSRMALQRPCSSRWYFPIVWMQAQSRCSCRCRDCIDCRYVRLSVTEHCFVEPAKQKKMRKRCERLWLRESDRNIDWMMGWTLGAERSERASVALAEWLQPRTEVGLLMALMNTC